MSMNRISPYQVTGDTTEGTSKMENNYWGSWGGGGGYRDGADFQKGAVEYVHPINFNGALNQFNLLGVRGGGGDGMGGILGQGYFPESGPMSSYPPWWNGYLYQNYGFGLSPNLSSPQTGPIGSGRPTNTTGCRGKKIGGDEEKYSRKVFIGGLPPDIDEDEIIGCFHQFGPLVVDWPRKSQSKGYFPPKGFCFLLFRKEAAVRRLIDGCVREGGKNKLFYFVSSPTIKAKRVQVRPWRLSDANFFADWRNGESDLDPSKVAFVGGVPRPLQAVELARLMDNVFGGVGYAGVSCDAVFKYPKGCGKVWFKSEESYRKAVTQRFVWIRLGNGYKQVEIKPFEGVI